MGHTVRITPAHENYVRKYQGAGPVHPLPQPQSKDEAMQELEQCRRLSLELRRLTSSVDLAHFWAVIPVGAPAASDLVCVQKMLELLEEQGDFDKAFVLFREWQKEQKS